MNKLEEAARQAMAALEVYKAKAEHMRTKHDDEDAEQALASLRDALAERVLQSREAEDADAARYRLLRSKFRIMSLDMGGRHSWYPRFHRSLIGPTLDAAIDSEIANSAGEAT